MALRCMLCFLVGVLEYHARRHASGGLPFVAECRRLATARWGFGVRSKGGCNRGVICPCTTLANVGMYSYGSALGRAHALCSQTRKMKAAAADVSIDPQVVVANDILIAAAETPQVDYSKMVEAFKMHEKLLQRNALTDLSTESNIVTALDGAWRLVLTADTDKQRITRFPLKGVLTIDTREGMLSNGIYVGMVPVLKFVGTFEFNFTSRKLEYDFDQIIVFGLRINLNNGIAPASENDVVKKFISATGLGIEKKVEKLSQRNKPFFKWIYVGQEIATTRITDGFDGFDLWSRDLDMEARMKTKRVIPPTMGSNRLLQSSLDASSIVVVALVGILAFSATTLSMGCVSRDVTIVLEEPLLSP